MLGAIAGDIAGSRFEGGHPPADFALFHADCRFTDDSVCTLAVAEALMGDRDYAAALRRFVRRHPQRGYGGMFRRWAESDDAGAYGSWANGAPMRTSAVGWLARDEDELLTEAAQQSAVTHDDPDAILAAQAVSLAIFRARAGVTAGDILEELEPRFGYRLAAPLAFGAGSIQAATAAQQGLAAALTAADWEGAVRTAIGLGGDTDTIGCIAGGVAEPLHGLPPEIAATARDALTDDLRAVLDRFAARR